MPTETEPDDKDPNIEAEAAVESQDGDGMTEQASAADYEVGYGRPPKHARFNKGESGNPKGRPKGAKNLKTHLSEVLNETIVVREGGRSKKITKLQAFVTALINGSIKGNAKSAGLLMNTIMRLLDTGANDGDGEEELGNDDLEVLHAQEERLLKRLAANPSSNASPDSALERATNAQEAES